MTALKAVQDTVRPYLQVVGEGRDDAPTVTDETLQTALQRLGRRGQALYRATLGEDEDRSSRLYELAALASEHGVDEETAYAIIASSPYNKFEGRDDESLRLWEAIERSRSDEREEQSVRAPRTRARSIGRLLARNTRPTEWLVEGIWENRGWGFVAGEPKTYKSTFATDLAVSIATATPFLGHFNVAKSGPVLIVQEENSESIQHARLARILRHKKRAGEIHSINGSILEVTLPDGDPPVYCVDRSRFSFNNVKKRRALEADIEAIQPRLVILDPFQRMLGELSVREEKDMTKCFDWLDKIVDDYKTGVMIVHHYHKSRESGPQLGGQRMLGSQALHAWLSCGLYLERQGAGEHGASIKVTREFRAFDSGPAFELEFDSEDDEDFYDVHVTEGDSHRRKGVPTEKQNELIAMVIEKPWLTASAYAEITGKGRRTIGEMLERAGCQKRKKTQKVGRPLIVFGPPAKSRAK